MEQRDASETPSESVDEEEPDPSFIDRYFWALLVGTILLSTAASAGVVYVQYGQVDQALQSIPYVDQAGQVAGAIPYVGSSADTSASASSKPQEYGSFTRMQGLVINPADSGGERYLAVSLAFESKSNSVMQEIKRKKVVVRDATLSLLSEQTVDELANPDRRGALKKKLLKKINAILSSGTVDRLYFTEFVLQ